MQMDPTALVSGYIIFAFTALLPAAVGNDAKCGRATVDENRIVNGATAIKGSHPWLVSLEYDLGESLGGYDHRCAGAIINKRWILTAAHCFETLTDMSKWRVVGGEYDKNVTEESEQNIFPKMILQHPEFNSELHTNDIALIQLSEDIVTGSTYSRRICLPRVDQKFLDHSFCVVAGWGSTFYTVSTDVQHKLQEYNSTILPLAECNAVAKIHSNGKVVTDDMICIKTEYDRQAKKGTGGICTGDSGGPLLCKLRDNQFYVAGVAAWSLTRPCGFTHDVFTRVQSFRRWMRRTMDSAAAT